MYLSSFARRSIVFLSGFLCLFNCFAAEEPAFIISLTSHVLPDGGTRIVWRTSDVMRSGRVIVSPAGQKSFELPERYDNMRVHAVTIPADKLAPGTPATVHVTHISQSRKVTSELVLNPPSARICAAPPREIRVELSVPEPSGIPRRNWPVRSGVPFAKGVLADAKMLRLTDAGGNTLPASLEVFSLWEDGSVKWLTCCFSADTDATGPVKFYLTGTGGFPSPYQAEPIADPGLLQKLRGELVLMDGRVLTACWDGNSHQTRQTTQAYDAVTVSGTFDGDRDLHWQLTGTWSPNGMVGIKWQIVRDSGTFFIPVRSFSWKGLPSVSDAERGVVQLRQNEGWGTENGRTTALRHAEGFFCGKSQAVYVRDFWQKWPKGLKSDREETTVEVLPALPEGYLDPATEAISVIRDYYWYDKGGYDLRSNMTLAGEFVLCKGVSATEPPPALFAHLDLPLFAQASPEYYCKTGVFGPISPLRPGVLANLERLTAYNFAKFLNVRESNREYGWMNYGDWFGESRYNWGNNEYDVTNLCALQFARTGRRNYLRRGAEMARHYTTIDHYRTFGETLPSGTMYPHLVGHIGSRLQADDGRFEDLENFSAGFFGSWQDTYGGHDFQMGNFLMGALLGDREIYDTACRATEALARHMTKKCNINIEREAGWFLQNQIAAYENTNDPFYLEAARCYAEKVRERQNPETGCMDLPSDPEECDCPDKKLHRGGKPFAAAVLLRGLIRYYEVTKDAGTREVIVKLADWLMKEGYDPATKKMYYTTACPKYNRRGTWFPGNVLDCFAYVGKLTGDRKYTDFAVAHLPEALPLDYGTCGKGFAQQFGGIPWLLHLLEEQGITETDWPQTKENQRKSPRSGEIILEAEDFFSEEGGAVQLMVRPSVSGSFVSGWNDWGHLLSWRFEVPEAGEYTIALRYAASASADRQLIVNGVPLGTFSFFEYRGNGSEAKEWITTSLRNGTAPLPLKLKQGWNRITLVNAHGDPMNLDYILLKRRK